MSDCDNIEELLSGYLDGELTQQVRQRVELHLDGCDGCRRMFDELRSIREGIGGLDTLEPTPEQWSRMMSTLANKTSRGVGWTIGIAGGALLAGFAAYEFAIDDSVDRLVKIGLAAVVGGAALLLLSVLVDRLRARKSDRYKDVEI